MEEKKFKIALVAIPGWKEAGRRDNFPQLRKRLSEHKEIKIFVPDYLEESARGKLVRFKTHGEIRVYVAIVNKYVDDIRKKYPEAKIVLLGHSLGGIIARMVQVRQKISDEDLILCGTPNLGIRMGKIKKFFFGVLAGKNLCNVPIFEELLPGSHFLVKLNQEGIPIAHFVSGIHDEKVELCSSDPHGTATMVDCGHSMFPTKENLVEKSAIPVVVKIMKRKIREC
jgi:pimeloyl-ACP methyl ester carboxylesterase